MLEILDQNEPLRAYAGPGHWNDPDMLEVGNGMSVSEDRAHFTLWCMMAAPLILGNDLTNMSEETLAIITNRDVIAIDQDPLGIQGFRFKKQGDLQYWFKPLSDGDWAFCLLNAGEEDATVELDWESMEFVDDLSGRSPSFAEINYQVKDLWNAHVKPFNTRAKGKKRGQTVGAKSLVVVPSHDVLTYRLTPVK